jgi:hypothetical protein
VRQHLQLFQQSRPLRPSLLSFLSRNRERKRLRPKAAPLKERKRKQRGLRQRPTSAPPGRKLNWLKPSITLSRLMIIPITPPRNGSSTNPSSPHLPAVSGRLSKNLSRPTAPLSIRLTTPTGSDPATTVAKQGPIPDAIPLLVKNFKRDALNQPF